MNRENPQQPFPSPFPFPLSLSFVSAFYCHSAIALTRCTAFYLPLMTDADAARSCTGEIKRSAEVFLVRRGNLINFPRRRRRRSHAFQRWELRVAKLSVGNRREGGQPRSTGNRLAHGATTPLQGSEYPYFQLATLNLGEMKEASLCIETVARLCDEGNGIKSTRTL